MSDSVPILAIIGGSGIYSMAGLEDTQEMMVDTPFGQPSAPIVVGRLEGRCIAFLARHGLGHRISPSEVNYRANIYALKSLGVQRIVSISACGSLRDDYAPGHIAVPDQLFDFTKVRQRSFFGDGLVVHVSTADPFCPHLSSQLIEATRPTGAVVHENGTMITIEGPRFSTRAESNAFRQWGMTLIGMTTSPEAFLAREAEMCYAVMAHVTDYDVWHITEKPVTVEQVVEILNANTRVAQEAVRNLLRQLPDERACECDHALGDALITARHAIPAGVKEKLDLLVRKYL
jgi:5'-methylthioadenosine phosphorylase